MTPNGICGSDLNETQDPVVRHGGFARRPDFYENQSQGLGDYFFNSLFSDIDSLRLYAGIHPVVHDHHRLLAKRFPFAVYYKLEGDLVVIHRVLDLRSDPEKHRKSL
jgi:hypothetical protein